MNANDEQHWLQQIKDFTKRALSESRATQEQLQSVNLELIESTPLSETTRSIWVDGGSSFFDVSGGSLYVVRAAAGLFQPDEKIRWFEKMDVGFTTLSRNVDRFVGLKRDILEIECLLELVEKGVDYAVLDNGLTSYASMGVPHSTLQYFSAPIPDDRPDFEYFQAFINFMKRFDVLIKQCLILDFPLIGAVKDPRSRSFVRQLGVGSNLNDSSAIALLAKGRSGFTSSVSARYLEVPRISQYLQANSILTNGRGEFMRVFGILKPNGNVFRMDYLQKQHEHLERIKQFAVSMHDGNGFLMPSHIVHNKATIPMGLSNSLMELIVTDIAKEDMHAARTIFDEQRRSRFG